MKHFLRAIVVFSASSFLSLQLAMAQTAATQADSGPAVSDVTDGALAALKSDFDLLKILGLVAIVVAVVSGLFMYVYRHKRLMQYDAVFGLVLTVVVAPVLLYLFTYLLGSESKACFSATLAAGADAVPFDGMCSAARESAANMIGFKSLWRMIMGEAVVNGMIAPLAAGAVKLLMYVSVVLGAALMYLAIRPILKRFG